MGKVLLRDQTVLDRGGFVQDFFNLVPSGIHFVHEAPLAFSEKVHMKVFGNGDEPGLKFISFIVGVNFIKGPRKCSYGYVFCVIFIFGAKYLKTVNIVPKSVQECTKGNLVSFFCLLYNLLDGIVGFFQKMNLT